MLCEVICSHFRINEIYKLKTAKGYKNIFMFISMFV